jgi:hypothetical protein
MRLFSDPHHRPFDFGGILLIDDDVELEEVEEFAQLFREDSRQILRFPARGKCFTDSKQSLIALPLAPLPNGGPRADFVFG